MAHPQREPEETPEVNPPASTIRFTGTDLQRLSDIAADVLEEEGIKLDRTKLIRRLITAEHNRRFRKRKGKPGTP